MRPDLLAFFVMLDGCFTRFANTLFQHVRMRLVRQVLPTAVHNTTALLRGRPADINNISIGARIRLNYVRSNVVLLNLNHRRIHVCGSGGGSVSDFKISLCQDIFHSNENAKINAPVCLFCPPQFISSHS